MNQDLLLRKQWFVTSKNQLLQNNYRLDKQLGSGAYGKVYRATELNTNRTVAIKMIQKSRVKDYKTFHKEFSILRQLDHPNIINIAETYQTDTMCYIVTELCSGGELFQRIVSQKSLNEVYAAEIMRKLFSAVAYCHQNDICHRDLKPQNILLVSSQPNSDIKLIDFGLAKQHTEMSVMHSMNGTPYYIAPEVLTGNYTNLVDCWSLGVIMYIMLSGTPPFNGQNNQEILLRVYNGSFNFRHRNFKQVSSLGKDLISRLLVKDDHLRLTASEAFQHPWISGLAPLPSTPISWQMYDDISNFISSQKLKRASLMYIASRLTDSDIEQLKTTFVAMDIDGNGLLSREELEEGFARSELNLDRQHLSVIWEMMDTNMNGKIDYTEFITGCLHHRQYCDQGYLRSAFEYFDSDKNGQITVDELRMILRDNQVNMSLPQNQIEEIIREVDFNGDGRIDYREFIQMMTTRQR